MTITRKAFDWAQAQRQLVEAHQAARRNLELMEEFKEYNWNAARYRRPTLTFQEFVAKRESNARHVTGVIYGGLVGQPQEVIATFKDGSLDDALGKEAAPEPVSEVPTIDDALEQVRANEQAFYDWLKSS